MKSDQSHLIAQNNKLVDFLIHLCDQAYGPKIETTKSPVQIKVNGEPFGDKPKKSHKKGAGKGNYPRKKKYECEACSNRFKSIDELIDATCPSCGSTNIKKA